MQRRLRFALLAWLSGCGDDGGTSDVETSASSPMRVESAGPTTSGAGSTSATVLDATTTEGPDPTSGDAESDSTDDGSLAASSETSASTGDEPVARPLCSEPGWAFPALSRRVALEVDNSITGSSANPIFGVPLLVEIDPSWFDYAVAASDGHDLRFRSPSGTPMAFEIDTWTPGGRSFVWVEFPEIPWGDESFATFTLYYGNPDIEIDPNADALDVFNRYVSVHHFNAGTRDSLGVHHAVKVEHTFTFGVPETCRDYCVPLIGEALTFDAREGDALMLEDSEELTFTGNTDRLSASFWLRTTNLSGTDGWTPILSKAESSWRIQQYNATRSPTLDFDCFDAAHTGICGTGHDHYGNFHVASDTVNMADGAWHHIAATFDYATNARWYPVDRPLTASLYFDGVLLAQQDFVSLHDTVPAMFGPGINIPVTLAMKYDDLNGPTFDGDIDELRLSAEAFDAAWFRAEHAIGRGDTVRPGASETCPSAPR